MISLDLRSKNFGDLPVLGAISLQIEHGAFIAVTGPSGIGKTTLLRIIAGLDGNFDGTLTAPETLAMVFQEPTLLPWRTALQNITIPAGTSDAVAYERLDEVGLGDRASTFPNRLSLGQQRRLALARALAVEPGLLLMDEPFVSLDPKLAVEMIELTRRLLAKHNTTTIMVTHSTEEARALADHIIRLDGTPARIANTS